MILELVEAHFEGEEWARSLKKGAPKNEVMSDIPISGFLKELLTESLSDTCS